MCAFSMVLSPLWKPRLITLTEKVTGERGALCPAIPRRWWASDNGQAGSRTHRRKWMGEKYKKERGGEGKKGKQSSLFLLSTRFAAQPLRPLLSLSFFLSLSSPPQVPPPTVDNLVRRMTGQSSYSVSFADRRRYYFVL